MENKTEIKKIVLQLGKKEVELTVEECKKLKEVLSEMFGKEVVKEIHHHDYYKWYWQNPITYYSAVKTTADPNIFYCSNTSQLSVNGSTLKCSL
jgi:hypothetical protein